MISRTIRTVILVIVGLIWLSPVYLLVINAAKSPAAYNARESWLPTDFSLIANLSEAVELSGLGESVVSTLLYATVSSAIAVVIGAAAGYAIVVLRLRHGFFWFVFLFGGSIFPIQMILLPLFDGYTRVDLYDERLGLVLIYTAISVPFAAFVMRNFFTGISVSVFEAAVLDGASTFRIFIRMYLPMSFSALVAIFILQATFIWNDLLLGLVLSQSDEVRPIVTTLAGMQNTYGGAQLSTVLAGGLIVSVPTVVLFMFTQRYFSKGLALGQY